jgi:hypothetical protein
VVRDQDVDVAEVLDRARHDARWGRRLEEVRLDVFERPFSRTELVEHGLHATRISALRLAVIER